MAASELPAALVPLLDRSALGAKAGVTFLLLTTSEEGFPHVALLSVGEIFAPSPSEVRLALWQGTNTTANLARTGRATLACVVDGAGHYVELEARPAGELVLPTLTLARFEARVRSARVDTVGYAVLECGIRYRLKNKDKVVARWEAQIAGLRRSP